MVKLVKHDLEFILKQIKIAEANAEGASLAELIDNPLLPYGLRTVDGSYNNLVPGREHWGAADQPFKNLLEPTYLNDADNDSMSFGPNAPIITNTDYGKTGDVADADPRIISNLIVDQSASNPAALAAMGAYDGSFRIDHDGNPNTPDLVFLPNAAPDDGISSPYNSWMTLFGQFFDHGLDLVTKGNSGTVYIPLQKDDPLYVPGGHTNFMVLTRLKADAGPDGRLGTADDVSAPLNTTTPWIDQNQTYTSHASHQAFLREYTLLDGKPVATGHLLEGKNGGLATWADIKEQARTKLGIDLTDRDVGNVPLLAADAYGNFIPGSNGRPQLVVGLGADGVFGTADDILREGNPANPVSTADAFRTGHAFLDDIAHTAAPNGVFDHDNNPATPMIAISADTDTEAGNSIATDSRGNRVSYDNELLDAHYIAGDGRANENIGLTAVHHVFHSEHNRIVEQVKSLVLDSQDLAFLNEWLLSDVAEFPVTAEQVDTLVWDGERLFQAGRFTTEMEYQHLVFEEFGRKLQPDINAFVFEPSIDIDPSIVAEFAHVVYRFGHSMLNEDVARLNMVNGAAVDDNIGLIEAFLNPLEFANSGTADQAAGAIIRGMTRQVGNEIDEFVTGALRNNLLGLPLDLATINIARARDAGVPSLNAARGQFFEATGDTKLKPYGSWVDFALNLKNPASIINFVAAYGTHDSITAETTVVGKRAAATALVLGQDQIMTDDPNTQTNEGRVFIVPGDRVEFLNSTDRWAAKETGLNTIDFWIGGLAEKKMSFGGMLGSTFSFVFETQLENLQDADRFYYLSRTQGLNLLNELENNSFAKLVMRNTDLGDEGSTVLPGDLFAAMTIILEMDQTRQIAPDPQHDDPFLEAVSKLVVRKDTDGDGDCDYIAYNGYDHVAIGGTEEADTIISGGGDDAIWAKAGDDYVEAGYGVDHVHGGSGNDIIVNAGTDIGEMDFLHGEEGDDVIHGGNGLALIFGNEGRDFIVTGPDGKEAFAGTGDDFILGGTGADVLLGNEGDDWLEGGAGFDSLSGENSELFFNSSIIGHDVLDGNSNDVDYDGESGDDIMVQGEGIQRNNGMSGFDWAIHKGGALGANSDLGIPIFVNQDPFILRDRFDLVEGLSGWKHDDILTGRAVVNGAAAGGGAAIPSPDSPLASYSNALLESGVARIAGLDKLLDHLDWQSLRNDDQADSIVIDPDDASDILLGGEGSDTLEGKAGDDILDGDAWLNVRISVRDRDNPSVELFTVDSMTEIQSRIFSREISPSQLQIVREIIIADGGSDTDKAVFSGNRSDYTITQFDPDSIRIVDNRGIDSSVAGDVVRRVESFQFADGVVRLVDLVSPATPDSGSILGTNGDDSLLGTDGNDAIDGLAGNDVIDGRAGDDMLFGNLGNDTLIGGAGDDYFHALAGDGWDTLDGGEGHDFAGYQTTRTGYTIAQVGDQAFTVTARDGSVDDLVGVEAIGFTDSYVGLILQQFISADGSTWNQGTYRADIMVGTDGVDGLRGGEGDDTLEGGAGRDYLEGEAGSDTLDGGADNDYAYYAAPQDRFTLSRDGDGTVLVTDTQSGDIDRLSAVEAVGFSDAPVTIVAVQRWDNPNSSSWHDGSIFADTISGTAAVDGMDGGLGDDLLDGGDSNDYVSGGQGSDTLIGGAGNDYLVGGAGADVFAFTASSGFDRIEDFSFADGDRIELAAGTPWGVFSNPDGAWLSFGPDAAVLLAGVQPDSVTSSWITFN